MSDRTIRITHYGHACVLAELAGRTRVLFDPGTYSAGFEELTGLDAVLITHEHPDHHDTERLPRLAQANPGARVVTTGDTDDSVTAGDAVVRIRRGYHRGGPVENTVNGGIMINLADLDESTPYLGQLKATTGPVTIINTFVAPEGKADEALAAWEHDADYMKGKPGFISAQLFRGIGGSRVFTNIAVWESTEHLLAAFGTPEFARQMKQYPDGTVAYPHLYQKAAVKGICVA